MRLKLFQKVKVPLLKNNIPSLFIYDPVFTCAQICLQKSLVFEGIQKNILKGGMYDDMQAHFFIFYMGEHFLKNSVYGDIFRVISKESVNKLVD